MTIRSFSRLAIAGAALAGALALLSRTPAQASAPTTKDNLLTAFNGESNAHARYLAFATRADEEGYARVAVLFRAAAKAEEVHAQNHAEVLRKLGVDAKPELKAPDVKSTRENVKAAIEGETYERDTMYPQFLDKARKDGDNAAVRTFNLAKAAEAEHAKLYTAALGSLDTTKGRTAEPMYVCTICGFTTAKIDFQKCPVCLNPKDKYVAVS